MVIKKTSFKAVRIQQESHLSFEGVVANLHAQLGEYPVDIKKISASTATWAEFDREVRPLAGLGSFMLFAMIDHSDWLPKAGIKRRALRVILGNPLIAITMMRHDLVAGLFAPVELLLLDNENLQGCSLTYLVPSSVMVVNSEHGELLEAAKSLDVELAALVNSVAT